MLPASETIISCRERIDKSGNIILLADKTYKVIGINKGKKTFFNKKNTPYLMFRFQNLSCLLSDSSFDLPIATVCPKSALPVPATMPQNRY